LGWPSGLHAKQRKPCTFVGTSALLSYGGTIIVVVLIGVGIRPRLAEYR
jgi:hypothetical protein